MHGKIISPLRSLLIWAGPETKPGVIVLTSHHVVAEFRGVDRSDHGLEQWELKNSE
jgi:hypothetical protein